MNKPSFYEFFAGGGMARAGLGDGWNCLFANDFDAKKAESYRANWGGEELFVGDVRKIETQQLPGRADLIWASFPCQDLVACWRGRRIEGRAFRNVLAVLGHRKKAAQGRAPSAAARA